MDEQPTSSLGDEALMHRIREGDQSAFGELMSRYESAVLTFCYGFAHNRHLAEDLSQEVFLRVYRNAARYEPVAKFSTWLYTIAANLCINELKKGRLRQGRSLDEPAGPNADGTRIVERIAAGGRAPVGEAEAEETQQLIRKAIDLLPEDQRTTLIMVEYHHMQYQEIAEILGVSVSAIKMRVKRAREILRDTLRLLQAQQS